tara:strand:+ start:988 stop:1209 length:222 start_codon:yes stop_codon:yes gene_type:complete
MTDTISKAIARSMKVLCHGEQVEVAGESFTLECYEGMVASEEVPAFWGSGGGCDAYTIMRECGTCEGTGYVFE